MRGHIRERGKNVWAVVVDVGRDESGKRKQKWHTVRGTKRDAERELARLLNELNTGEYVESSTLTVGEYLEKWLKEYAKTNVSAGTFEFYSGVVRKHLVPALGRTLLARLQPLHIQSYYTAALAGGRRDGKGGLSARSVLHHHRILSQALGQAVRWQILPRNPADAVEPPRAVDAEMNFLDGDGMRRILAAVAETQLYLPVLLALATGMRRGEILGLRWDDVNAVAGTLCVRQSLEETAAGLRFKAPKTRSSRRTIHLPPSVASELARFRMEQEQAWRLLGTACRPQGLVCCWEDGGPLRPHYVTLAFSRLVRKLGLPVRFHDLRHTQATALIAQGEHLKVISSRLGHSSVQVTLDRYGHLIPGIDRAAAERMDGIFRRDGEEGGARSLAGGVAQDTAEPGRLQSVCKPADGEDYASPEIPLPGTERRTLAEGFEPPTPSSED